MPGQPPLKYTGTIRSHPLTFDYPIVEFFIPQNAKTLYKPLFSLTIVVLLTTFSFRDSIPNAVNCSGDSHPMSTLPDVILPMPPPNRASSDDSSRRAWTSRETGCSWLDIALKFPLADAETPGGSYDDMEEGGNAKNIRA